MKILFVLLLPHLIFCSDKKENICSICYDKLNFESNALRTQCGHDFHTKCLTRWINTDNSCPLCRFKNPRRMTQIERNVELRKSARINNLPKLREMIRQGADVNSSDVQKNTALMFAAVEGNIDVIEELLKYGAFLESRSLQNLTALMYAVIMGKTDVVKLFLERGAHIYIELEHVLIKPEIKKLIIQHANYRKLRSNALGNSKVNEMIASRRDLNWTPLIYAAVAVFAVFFNIFVMIFLLRNDYN